jgi:hypothetical protein
MQLDIFEHSREVMLRNDVAQALECYDAAAARAAVDRLATEYLLDDSLPASRALLEAIDVGEREAFGDHAALRLARQALSESIRPAALRIFPDKAADAWLARQWQGLAQRAHLLAFNTQCPDDHAAPMWLNAREWKAAAQAVKTIESWRRIPVPLAWMVEARLHLLGLEATWPMLAELGWLSPLRLDDLGRRSPDPLLPQLMREFEAEFDGAGDASDLAWFAAWVLTQRPRLSEQLATAQASQHTPPEQAMRLLVELLGLERQGRHHDIIPRRKALRDLQPSLYAAYMGPR